MAARLVEPVEHFEISVEIDALDGGHPGFEDLEPANRAIVTALSRRHQPRGPGHADAADEDEAGIARRRQIDGQPAVTEFIFANHFLSLLRSDAFSKTLIPVRCGLPLSTAPAQRARSVGDELIDFGLAFGANSGGKPSLLLQRGAEESSLRARSRLASVFARRHRAVLTGAATRS